MAGQKTRAGNFKLVLTGKAIDWLNHTRDILGDNISTCTNIEPKFILYFNVKMNTVNNVWDFSKSKHKDKNAPASHVGLLKTYQQCWLFPIPDQNP